MRVTTPCGHNFCKSCLTQCWEKSQHCHCPLCKEKFTKRPELKINTTLREVADHFKKKSGHNKPEVLCDACTGQKLKALKSCLDCCAAFCKTHLEPHNNIPKLKKHKLINPVENLEDYICQKHERALELFCRDDQTCVCQFCTEGDHKNHNTVPIEEESRERKTRLGKTQTDVQQMIQDRLKKIQEIKHSVELSKRSTEKEKADSVEVFTALIRSIERSQAELLKVMEEKQKAAERQAEGLIKELEKEITVLKRRDTELEQLSHTEEHLHLLQSFSSGRFYYEVQVRGKTDWDLGVATESINRKGKITLRPQNGFWTVGLRNENQYWACADPSVPLTLREKVEKVGVFVDYEEGLVSFYDVESSSHIYSFTACLSAV
ncbi:hypothetical protein PGIGA_G00201220 [Pangasianodon gigas]|uniref:Uncharacterized protein n=1 Tax=Pangasianodon gigas TaxID=30993 RepID=A0ACC5WDN5_PANGG|nr:hypothetical protein [Pangasianodon gigas]